MSINKALLLALIVALAPVNAHATSAQTAPRTLIRAILAHQAPHLGYADTAEAKANKGIAITIDQKRLIVNKLQSDGRWTVILDRDKLDVIGNVTGNDGSVAFIQCLITGASGTDIYSSSFYVSCFSGVVNTAYWNPLGSFTIPASFFLP